ncbi:tetratricopeptide repeat protein [Lysobacter tyrosinilyticus]
MYALLLAAALLAAPGNPVASPPLPPAPPATVMAMPPELRQRLQDEVLSTRAGQRQRVEQLLHFMLDPNALGIVYDEDATNSVAQTYAIRKANCLSFTLFFIAIAREAGFEAHAQEIKNTLSWRQEEGTIYRNNHINAGVLVGGRNLTVDTSSDRIITGELPVAISEQRLLAHYYNNLAMEQLDGDFVAGLKLMDVALEAAPDYAPLWSNAGVLHMRDGDLAAAERSYRKALELDPDEDGALFNMVSLAHRQGDGRREAEFRRRLARVEQKDPLHHFMEAMDYERNGDYAKAIAHYRRAIHLFPGEHRFYSALAQVYLKAGDPKRAAKALLRAQALTQGATRAAYSTRLRELKGPSN